MFFINGATILILEPNSRRIILMLKKTVYYAICGIALLIKSAQSTELPSRIEYILLQNLSNVCESSTMIEEKDVYSFLEEKLPEAAKQAAFPDACIQAFQSFNKKIERLKRIDMTMPRDLLVIGATPTDTSIVEDDARFSLIERADFLNKHAPSPFPAFRAMNEHHLHIMDITTPDFKVFSTREKKYKTIMFDWCVLNCVVKNSCYAFSESTIDGIFETLELNGILFLSDVAESNSMIAEQLKAKGFEVQILKYDELPEQLNDYTFKPLKTEKSQRCILAKKTQEQIARPSLESYFHLLMDIFSNCYSNDNINILMEESDELLEQYGIERRDFITIFNLLKKDHLVEQFLKNLQRRNGDRDTFSYYKEKYERIYSFSESELAEAFKEAHDIYLQQQ
ncbi:MAG: hypothetical protein HEEMFOPI_01731 [Holosporales bacterium]